MAGQPSTALPGALATALWATLTCTDWQGIRTCVDGHGYVAHESAWQGRTNGWDNKGNTWSTSQWQDQTIITLKRNGE